MNDSLRGISATVAAAYLKQGCEAFVAVIRTEETKPEFPATEEVVQRINEVECPDVSKEYHEALKQLLREYADCFCTKLPTSKSTLVDAPGHHFSITGADGIYTTLSRSSTQVHAEQSANKHTKKGAQGQSISKPSTLFP
jgi:hypothetical protein